MKSLDFDLLVIGAGSGGIRAARVAASLGASVGVAEDRYLGGTCVNVGCVPKKLFFYASSFSAEFESSSGFGWTLSQPSFKWKTLISNKNREIKRLNGIYRKLLESSGVRLLDGRAVPVDPHTVRIGKELYRAKHILVATGSWPSVPNIPGKQYIVTSNEAFFLEKLPKRVIIVGGGYIAVEFAGIFNGLGAETILVYRGPLFLRGFDEEIRKFLAGEMAKKGIDLRFNSTIAGIDEHPSGLSAKLADGARITADTVMYATGRAPNTKNLGLEKIGVKTNQKGAIEVDTDYRSTIPSIYAIGDVTDRINLTPVALAEGTAVANSLFGNCRPVNYESIPSCIFCQPNLGTVGLTEQKAKLDHGEIDVYRSTFTPLKHTLSGSDEKTLMKLVVDKKTDRIVGVHMVGPDAGEIIQGIAVALKAGATKSTFDSTIGIHPTAAEEFVTM